MKIAVVTIGLALFMASSAGAACGPSATTPESKKPVNPEAKTLFESGQTLQRQGKDRESLAFYEKAAKLGNAEAAKALGDIYAEGKGSVPKDYSESLRSYALAQKLGYEFEKCRR